MLTQETNDLPRAIRERILKLTLALIERPAAAREISATIKDLERLLKVIAPLPPSSGALQYTPLT